MSDTFELLVIGGGPAAHAATRAYRGAGATGSAAIVADEGRPPYERPPLTKDLLRGEAGEEALALTQEDELAARDIALVAGRAVVLEPDHHRVVLSGGRELHYGRCVIATGAEPLRLPVPGTDDPAVQVLRSLDHFRELNSRLTAVDRVAVIGSGFIGCEIAASLRRRGHPVTLISDEPAPNAARLGDEVGERIAEWLRGEGIEMLLSHGLDSIERDGVCVRLTAGSHEVTVQVAVMAAGVAPRLELAITAGLEIRDGAISVDAAMRTSASDVLAAGDVCRAFNATAGRPLRVEHWGDALGQGEVAGATAAGRDAQWDDVPGFWSTIGDHTLKYVAWGDGHDDIAFADEPNGAFVARYHQDGQLVGVLAHERRGRIRRRAPRDRRAGGRGAMTYVVVPAHNERDRIGACLRALAEQTVGPDAFTVVLVLDACRDDTDAIARQTASELSLALVVLGAPRAARARRAAWVWIMRARRCMPPGSPAA